MPPEPLHPIHIPGRTDEESAALQAAFKGLYAKMYPHWEADIKRYLEDNPPKRTDWSFVDLADLADMAQDDSMSRWERMKLRGLMVYELCKSLVPITPWELRAHLRNVTDGVTGQFIAMWIELLQRVAMHWGGSLDVSRLDEAMLPTGLPDGALEQLLYLGDVPFENIRAVMTAVRKELTDNRVLPPEVETFMTAFEIPITDSHSDIK